MKYQERLNSDFTSLQFNSVCTRKAVMYSKQTRINLKIPLLFLVIVNNSKN